MKDQLNWNAVCKINKNEDCRSGVGVCTLGWNSLSSEYTGYGSSKCTQLAKDV